MKHIAIAGGGIALSVAGGELGVAAAVGKFALQMAYNFVQK